MSLRKFLIWAQFFITGISAGLPIPCGVYAPVFMVGAAMGRLLGEVMAVILPASGIVPGGYAVVGAAAFSAGVTRTIASAIILFELTGQLTHLLPVLLSVLIASSVGNFCTLSVYDELLREKGLPFMPPIRTYLCSRPFRNFL